MYNHDYRSVDFLQSRITAVQKTRSRPIHNHTHRLVLLNQWWSLRTCLQSLQLPACQMPVTSAPHPSPVPKSQKWIVQGCSRVGHRDGVPTFPWKGCTINVFSTRVVQFCVSPPLLFMTTPEATFLYHPEVRRKLTTLSALATVLL